MTNIIKITAAVFFMLSGAGCAVVLIPAIPVYAAYQLLKSDCCDKCDKAECKCKEGKSQKCSICDCKEQ